MDKNVSSSNYTKESDLFQRTKGDSQQKLMCTCAGALSVCHSWEEADTAFSWQSECNSSKKYLCTQPLIPVSVLWGPGLSLMPWEPLHLSLVQWGSDSSTLPSSAFDVHLNSRSRGWRSKVLGGKIMSQKAACLWGGLERGCVLRRLGERLGSRLLCLSTKRRACCFLFCFSLLSFGVLPPASPAFPSPFPLFIEGRFG